jgi:predicted RNA-binding Zn-ribbon protein involved in translation (DUF1610 family)
MDIRNLTMEDAARASGLTPLTMTKSVTPRHCLSCRDDVAPDQTECPFCDEDTITQDELADRAERQAEEQAEAFHEGGSSFRTMDEQHRAAWEQKQALRR